MKNRKIVAKNRSGGIILGYRQEIASKIKPLHTNSKYVFWFKVSSDLVNLDQDIIRSFTINKLFPLQKSKSFLPYPFFIGSELLLLRGICSSSSVSTSFSIYRAASYRQIEN
jgi:hypothetical protein